MQEKTNARKGEVIRRDIGGGNGSAVPSHIVYLEVTNECGHNGFYGPKDVREVSYEDYKRSGVEK